MRRSTRSSGAPRNGSLSSISASSTTSSGTSATSASGCTASPSWSARARPRSEFVAQAHAVLGDGAPDYDNAFPPQQDYQGLTRYWAKRRDAEGA